MITTNLQKGEEVAVASGTPDVTKGTAGLATQVPGQPVTVSAAAAATAERNDNFIGAAIDEELFLFNSEDTPLMNLMLRSKRVDVNSPEVDHYMIDEAKSMLVTVEESGGNNRSHAVLYVDENDAPAIRPHTTLLAKGVPGYLPGTTTPTPGKDLLLFVTGQDNNSSCPVVRAVNGPCVNAQDEFCNVPSIPAGTQIMVLANSLYETQKEVDPDLMLPQPTRIYLQKRGMNQVVSDYFESQKKRMPFSQAIIAEQAIANFKVRGNRTLWASRAGKIKVGVPKMGMQYAYTTEGLRWQFKREFRQEGTWSVDKIITLAKMFFTGEDVPKSAILLAGKDLLEAIQKVDYSKHPEIHISTKVNSVGWVVTNFHTVFGDIEIKREPTLDRLGWSRSGALIGENRLVHYVYSAEHSFEDRVEGEEATRNGILIWDAVALKGTCHIWIDGEDENSGSDAERIIYWESEEAPADYAPGTIVYLATDCPGIATNAKSGQFWQLSSDSGAWTLFKGSL